MGSSVIKFNPTANCKLSCFLLLHRNLCRSYRNDGTVDRELMNVGHTRRNVVGLPLNGNKIYHADQVQRVAKMEV